jgi:hypothetical protein
MIKRTTISKVKNTFLDEVKATYKLNHSILLGKYEQELREKILDASKQGLMQIIIEYPCNPHLQEVLQAVRNICTEPGFKYCLDTHLSWRITLSWEFPA